MNPLSGTETLSRRSQPPLFRQTISGALRTFVHWYNQEHRHSGVRYVTLAQRHAGQDGPCLPPTTRSTRTHDNATHNTEVDRPATGHQLASSPSIRSATSSSGRQPHKFSFPVRSASLLSRPDSAAPTNGAQRRRRQSHPQPRAARPVAREHGEDGEHRTFSEVSTVVHSSSVGSPHLRTSVPQAQRHRR
jgi:hypothetical protein